MILVLDSARSLGWGATDTPPFLFCGGDVSWKATAWVKTLTHLPNGKLLTARQKLLLFVLADYHNDDRQCAWAGLRTIAKDTLTSRQHVITLLNDLEKSGIVKIKHRQQESNIYFFPTMGGQLALPGGGQQRRGGGQVRVDQGGQVAALPEPSLNRHKNRQEAAVSSLALIGKGPETKMPTKYDSLIEELKKGTAETTKENITRAKNILRQETAFTARERQLASDWLKKAAA